MYIYVTIKYIRVTYNDLQYDSISSKKYVGAVMNESWHTNSTQIYTYVCIYIHICIHIYINLCIYITHAYICVCIYIHIYTNSYI